MDTEIQERKGPRNLSNNISKSEFEAINDPNIDYEPS